MRSKSKTEKNTFSHFPTYCWALHSWVFCSTEGMGNGDLGQFVTLMPLPCPPSRAVPLLQCQVPPNSLLQTSPMCTLPKICRFAGITPVKSFSIPFSPSGSDRLSGSDAPAWFLHRSQLLTEKLLLHGFLSMVCSFLQSVWFMSLIFLSSMPAATWGFLLTLYWHYDGQLALKSSSYQLFLWILLLLLAEPRQLVLCYD